MVNSSNLGALYVLWFFTYRVGQKNGATHFVLRFVTRNIDRSVSNLAQIKVISFLTLHSNLIESSLENKVAPSSA